MVAEAAQFVMTFHVINGYVMIAEVTLPITTVYALHAEAALLVVIFVSKRLCVDCRRNFPVSKMVCVDCRRRPAGDRRDPEVRQS